MNTTNIHFKLNRLLCPHISLAVTLLISVLLSISLFQSTYTVSYGAENAKKLTLNITDENQTNLSKLKDGSYHTAVSINAGKSLSVSSDDTMYGIYVIWNTPASGWTLKYTTVSGNSISKSCGTNGFLHEYIAIPEGTSLCTLTFNENTSLCDIYAYGNGTLPNDVQVWQPSLEKADILVFSTHADDEILFLGGPIVTYASREDVRVQVVYMCEFWSTSKVREHEKLDGLWECGVNYYPVCGNFKDLYSTSLETAKTQYNYSVLIGFVTEQIRRFKPQVCVTQDLNGEYGHGGHIILANAFCEAINNCHKNDFHPASVNTYGTWDVKKTYLHLYPENKININVRTPISSLGGRTGLDVLKSAYKKHVSQQYCWFYVSDDYQYSCSAFGMYRSTVGADTGNDMLEHIITYQKQEELAKAEAESIAASIAASRSASIEESIQASIAESQKESYEAKILEEKQASNQRNIFIIGIISVIGITFTILGICYIRAHRK